MIAWHLQEWHGHAYNSKYKMKTQEQINLLEKNINEWETMDDVFAQYVMLDSVGYVVVLYAENCMTRSI